MQKLALLTGLTGLTVLAAQGQPGELKGKKLIEFGWDEPSTAFLRAHADEMQRAPFDGCVFHADYQKSDGSKGSFSWNSWGQQTFVKADLQAAFQDARLTRLGRLQCNFLRFNTTPAKLDWFDDYSSVVVNATLAARLARASHCRGLLFDTEQYQGHLFDYHRQRYANTKSWELYAAQARLRGGQVMQAFHEGYPGLTLFLTFAYSLPWEQSEHGRRALADGEYGLLAPFLDGMLGAAQGRERIVDGFELSYGYKTAQRFMAGRNVMKHELLPMVRDADRYHRVLSVGFGIWLDFDWRKKGWHTEDPSQNYFPPEVFAASVTAALQQADEYVWIYSETPRWWSDGKEPVKLPDIYSEVLNKVRKGLR